MNRKHILMGLIVGGLLMYGISNSIVDKRLSLLRSNLDNEISAHTTELQNLATTLGRGGSVEKINTFIRECPSEQITKYDTLLSDLDQGLTRTELSELYGLFNRCGDTTASRRAGLVLLLENEVSMYEQLITQRIALGENEETSLALSDWKELVAKEKTRSELYFSLVEAQEEILVALMENVPPTSLVVENIRSRAQTIREELDVLSGDISTLRTSLIKT